ncbi:MAG: DEAD/DEAH box helicase [Methylocystis sp.]|nr:DEAD/DEAH box helicase [Methylocystis sp.]MCA3583024.1 DEAD/DEAH box helicase [Methylocystis sp.]MCA3587347.1 DEAD/DEAH box helicase [Methylocystis sp.]MCA3590429.1 DEAD/DEAH box helicase [Methylocystis sp.]
MTDALHFTPRPHQREARDRILAARDAGRPGFLLGDLTGLGKTLSVWLAILAMPENEVLIICPKGAVPQWRRTMAHAGAHAKTVTILNYERTKSLLAPPAASKRRSVRARNNELARHGSLKRSWPIVVFDESHRLRNPNAQQTMACRQVADAARFAIYMSATAGQSPHELSYLGKLLAHGAGLEADTLDGFRQLMKKLGIGKVRGRWKNWSWAPNERDRALMADLLYKGGTAIGLRRRPGDIAGWPEVQRELAPVALDNASRALYAASWKAFRTELGLAGGSTRTPSGRVAELRFRQKASLLRIAGTADFTEALLDNGEQAAISVAFLETGAMLAETLRSRGWRVSEINGERTGEANEQARIAFQTGEADLVIFTVTESISLHEGEMQGGEKPRALIIHDMRHSAIQLQQIEGRCHRDGQRALIHYAFAEDTAEELVTARVVARMSSMDGMAGDDIAMFDDIAGQLEKGRHSADGSRSRTKGAGSCGSSIPIPKASRHG